MIRGVMRGYVRDSRLRDVERSPVLMISLLAYSSSTSVPNIMTELTTTNVIIEAVFTAEDETDG